MNVFFLDNIFCFYPLFVETIGITIDDESQNIQKFTVSLYCISTSLLLEGGKKEI